MPETPADTIGTTTGTYLLPCGCRIYVHFPAGAVHLEHGGAQCPELHRLWVEYSKTYSYITGHSWESLTRYLDCLRHVGAWEGLIRTIERLRAMYPAPATRENDHETEVRDAVLVP